MIYNNSIQTLKFILSHLNILEHSNLRKEFIRYYEDEINQMLDVKVIGVETFNKSEFLDSLQIDQLPLLLGLRLSDFIIKVANYVPSILITYEEENNIFRITNL